jgi:hypothetical protein
MAKTNNTAGHIVHFGQSCPEVLWSGRLARLAAEAQTSGFPCTAEQLRHLAGYVLDEAATKYHGGQPQYGDGEPDLE